MEGNVSEENFGHASQSYEKRISYYNHLLLIGYLLCSEKK